MQSDRCSYFYPFFSVWSYGWRSRPYDHIVVRTYAVEPFWVTKTRFSLRQHGTLRSSVCRFCARRAQKRQTRKEEVPLCRRQTSANCVSPIYDRRACIGLTDEQPCIAQKLNEDLIVLSIQSPQRR